MELVRPDRIPERDENRAHGGLGLRTIEARPLFDAAQEFVGVEGLERPGTRARSETMPMKPW